jgi:magnesium transporter
MTITVFDHKESHSAKLSELPDLLKSPAGTIWVDLVGPGEEELELLRNIFHFHPLAIEDTRNQWQRPKVEEYADYLFVILDPVVWERGKLSFRELDVFVGHNYVVTVHQADEPVIKSVEERLARTNLLPVSASYLLYVLMDVIVDGYFPVLDEIEDRIDWLGDAVLTHPGPRLLSELFELKTALVKLWRVVWPQREIPNRLSHHDLPFLDQETVAHYLRDVSDHLMWIADMVSTFRDTLTGVMDLYMSAVSNRLNKVVNRLTVITVIIGVLTVIGGFYGMNFEHTWPPFSADLGVPFVVFLMGAVIVGLLVLFKKLDWY